MVKVVAAVALVAIWWAHGALAQVSPAVIEAVRDDPARFEARFLDLIAGFGGPDGLTAEGIDEHVALDRASARASALRRFHVIDLDADGQVTRSELRIAQRAATARVRGRMERQFLSADGNGDNRVDQVEIAAEGEAAALRAVSKDEVDLMHAALALDSDGDGALDASDLRAALARIKEAT
jgi:Ca2+-binding EF-hand superfamily protein